MQRGSCVPPIFDPLYFSTVSMDILAMGRASARARATRQRQRFDALLTRALRESRFYQKHLRGAVGGTTRLESLPSVSRQALMAHFDDWVTDPALTLAGLQAFTADSGRIGQPYLGKYLVWESSGTSPVSLYRARKPWRCTTRSNPCDAVLCSPCNAGSTH